MNTPTSREAEAPEAEQACQRVARATLQLHAQRAARAQTAQREMRAAATRRARAAAVAAAQRCRLLSEGGSAS